MSTFVTRRLAGAPAPASAPASRADARFASMWRALRRKSRPSLARAACQKRSHSEGSSIRSYFFVKKSTGNEPGYQVSHYIFPNASLTQVLTCKAGGSEHTLCNGRFGHWKYHHNNAVLGDKALAEGNATGIGDIDQSSNLPDSIPGHPRSWMESRRLNQRRIVEFSGLAHVGQQRVAADMQHVDALHGGDVLHIVQALNGLDHADQQTIVVELRHAGAQRHCAI